MDREWGARDALAFVRRTDFAPSAVAFDAAMQRADEGDKGARAALRLAEVEVAGEDRAAPVEPAQRVLHVHVVDAVGELLDEGGRVEELVREVARVEVDPEALAVADRLERLAGRDEVVGDLGRVHLEREVGPLAGEERDRARHAAILRLRREERLGRG